MHYIIYLDEFFCVNFIMDYVILSFLQEFYLRTTVAKSKGEQILQCIRKMAGAGLGAFWASIIVTFHLKGFAFNMVTYFVICPIMVISVAKLKPKQLIKAIVSMYAITCALAGAIHIVYYYTSIGYFLNMLGENRIVGIGIGPLMAATIVGYSLLRASFNDIREKLRKKNNLYSVCIINQGKKVMLCALRDTGNSLIDPYCGEAVNVVEERVVTRLIDSYENCGYHLVPTKSIGNSHGLVPVVRFDTLIIIEGKHKIIITKPLFALYSGELSQRGDFYAILHPEMFGERENNDVFESDDAKIFSVPNGAEPKDAVMGTGK